MMSKKPASKSKAKAPKSAKKATKQAAAASPGAADAPPIASQITLPSGAAVKRILNTQHEYAVEISEVTGSLRGDIGNAVKNDNINKSALAMMKSLDKLSRQKHGGLEKLAVRMAHFLHMYAVSGLKEKVDSVMSLNLSGEPASDPQAEAEVSRAADDDGPPTTILPATEDDVSQPRFTH